MFFNLDLIIIVLAIIILIVSTTYTFYLIITTLFKSFNVKYNRRLKLAIIRLSLSFTGTVSTHVKSTVVELSDDELNQLLQVVFDEIGSSIEISAALLQSLGLYTPSVISYLEQLGYIIIN
jgi:hypothetical protein